MNNTQNITQTNELPEVKVKTTKSIREKGSVIPNRFSVRGMRKHPGIITNRTPRVG